MYKVIDPMTAAIFLEDENEKKNDIYPSEGRRGERNFQLFHPEVEAIPLLSNRDKYQQNRFPNDDNQL